MDNGAYDLLLQEAINARIDGVHLLLATIGHGLTHGRNYLNLQGIASDPIAANFFNVRSYNDVASMAPKVVAAMCNGELLRHGVGWGTTQCLGAQWPRNI